ncbi:chitin synthase-domain-containing protein [Gongronella butleri]|nr:chitin synthase-domain-containing protein [Gongronella butleri]
MYLIMRRRMENTLVSLTGISGSGKSHSHQQVVKAILSVSTSTRRREIKLQQQVMHTLTVLDAFGASRVQPVSPSTQEHHLHQRFNMCHTLYFNDRGHLTGAYVAACLFDKQHVTRTHTSANYDVFYQLLEGTSPDEKSALHINYAQSHFAYLKNTARSHSTNSAGENDADTFIRLKDALKSLGIKAKIIVQICQLLAAILHLGNVHFISGSGHHLHAASSAVPPLPSKDAAGGNESCRVKNKDTLALVAAALGVSTTKLENTLTHKLKLIGKEFCSAFLTGEAAVHQRDQLAQSLYALLFQWLLATINQRLAPPSGQTTTTTSATQLTILDFMAQVGPPLSNASNSHPHRFYDLCCHFATEQLHQWQVALDFDGSGAVSGSDSSNSILCRRRQDGLSSLPCPSPDFFASSMSLWHGDDKHALVPSLLRECQRFQAYALDATDSNWLLGLFQKKKRQPEPVFAALKSPSTPTASFAIQHYSCLVDYSVDGFLEANVDAFSPDFIHLFRYGCTNQFVHDLFYTAAPSNANGSNYHHEKGDHALDDTPSVHHFRGNHDNDGNKRQLLSAEYHPRDDRTIIKAQLGTQPLFGWLHDASFSSSSSSLTATTPPTMNMMTQQLEQSMALLRDVYASCPHRFEIIHVTPVHPWRKNSTEKMDEAWLMEQLTMYKVPEYVQRQQWTATCLDYSHDAFLQRYTHMFSHLVDQQQPMTASSAFDQCHAIVHAMQWSGFQCTVGHARIWLRFDLWYELERHLRTLEKEARTQEKARQELLEAERRVEEETKRQADIEAEALALKAAQAALEQQETATLDGSWHSNPFADDNWSTDDRTIQDWSDDESKSQDDDDDAKGLAEGLGPNMDMSQMVEDYCVQTEELIEEVPITRTRQWWSRFVWFMTWWIPSFTLRLLGKMKRQDVQMAWREKVTLCLLIFFFSATTIFVIVGLNQVLCPGTRSLFSANDVSVHQSMDDYWFSAHGFVYDATKFVKKGHGNAKYMASASTMEPLAGRDLSYTFPLSLTVACPSLVTDNSITIIPNETIVLGPFVHASGPQQPDPQQVPAMQDPYWLQHRFFPAMLPYKKGHLVQKRQQLQDDFHSYGRLAIVIHERIYDLTDYMNTARHYAEGSKFHFFHPSVERLFTTFAGQDASQAWDQLGVSSDVRDVSLSCLDNRFYVGRLDYRDTIRCTFTNYLLLSFALLMSVVILVKMLAALQFGSAPHPEEQDKFIICQVPCYTEDEMSLRKTIESIAVTQYDDRRKLLLLIADGMIIGSGNDKPTPHILLDILGHPRHEYMDTTADTASFASKTTRHHEKHGENDHGHVDADAESVSSSSTLEQGHFAAADDEDDGPYMFKSVGEGSQQLNYGKVYSGLFQHEGHTVPYLVVVKVGKSTERTKPGNRGKRDSQIICMNFLNRVHFDAPMNPLELEMYRHIKHVIGLEPALYEYLLMVDSDTVVAPDCLTSMVGCMLHDSRIIGLCGETELANEDESWATRIQVYEYYISHHLVKAFESLFGSVTCLPGCFCMYRIRAPNAKQTPLIISPTVIHGYSDHEVDTLHKKNLLHLGEDRYLTTLVMKTFPQYKLVFTPHAKCQTAAPDRWHILLSQRRRWINSTIHNLLELAMLPELCGFCCLSMRFVVIADLIGTITLPSSVVYLGYLVYQSVSGDGPLPVIALGMLAGAYGLQAIVFIVKRQWQHIGWMIIYILAIPVFCFAIPLYSFWHMDDFSWGSTRVVMGDHKKQIIVTDGEKFDEKMIPMQKWLQYEAGLWERNAQRAARARERREWLWNKRQKRQQRKKSAANTKDASALSTDLLLQPLNFEKDREWIDLVDMPALHQFQNDKHASNNPDAAAATAGHGTAAAAANASLSLHATRSHHHEDDLFLNVKLPEDDDLEREIRKLLLESNLMDLTKKQVRDHLSQLFGVDLTIKKGYINATIERLLETEFT